MKTLRCVILFCVVVFSVFITFSCAHSRPPKPGPNFVWVKPVKKPSGVIIPGHWKHTGPAKKAKVWVPRHVNANGTIVPGHWRNIKSPRKKGVWVPGHHGPRGRWIPGHWK